ncbi:universal stress protein [Glutamicibacter arilaitensis]|uniref:universal stress protein n=1 Tax=Glutamicibacter arilaitensis TaxID=256701 RepID=UPI00384D8DF4
MTERILLVGIEPGQAPAVLEAVIELAETTGAKIMCLYADSGRFVTERLPTGEIVEDTTFDGDEQLPQDFSPALAEQLSRAFSGKKVSWAARTVAGDPAKALMRVAEELDAQMIAIGTRRPGLRSRMEELMDGSIAVALTHRQSRPVLVVPQVPGFFEEQSAKS